jgi:hypothetical protein
MSTGGGRTNRQMLEQQRQAQQQQQQVFNRMMERTPEQQRWDRESSEWSRWLEGKDYSQAPTGTTLNFDLWNPSRINEQRQRMADLDGVGAAALGGDNSVALQLARERNANAAATDAGAAYESAVKQTDAYYKGNALPYAQFEMSRLNSLLGNATNREQYYNNAYIQTRPQSLFPSLLGGALSAGMSMLMPGSGLLAGLGGGGGSRGPQLHQTAGPGR